MLSRSRTRRSRTRTRIQHYQGSPAPLGQRVALERRPATPGSRCRAIAWVSAGTRVECLSAVSGPVFLADWRKRVIGKLDAGNLRMLFERIGHRRCGTQVGNGNAVAIDPNAPAVL